MRSELQTSTLSSGGAGRGLRARAPLSLSTRRERSHTHPRSLSLGLAGVAPANPPWHSGMPWAATPHPHKPPASHKPPPHFSPHSHLSPRCPRTRNPACPVPPRSARLPGPPSPCTRAPRSRCSGPTPPAPPPGAWTPRSRTPRTSPPGMRTIAGSAPRPASWPAPCGGQRRCEGGQLAGWRAAEGGYEVGGGPPLSTGGRPRQHQGRPTTRRRWPLPWLWRPPPGPPCAPGKRCPRRTRWRPWRRGRPGGGPPRRAGLLLGGGRRRRARRRPGTSSRSPCPTPTTCTLERAWSRVHWWKTRPAARHRPRRACRRGVSFLRERERLEKGREKRKGCEKYALSPTH
jgi:hypothetical protein